MANTPVFQQADETYETINHVRELSIPQDLQGLHFAVIGQVKYPFAPLDPTAPMLRIIFEDVAPVLKNAQLQRLTVLRHDPAMYTETETSDGLLSN